MKIAVPTRNNNVDEHFGHCEYYTILTVSEQNKIEKQEVIESPKNCGCKSEIAAALADMGVKVMLAGNMGQGAVSKVSSAGIEVIRGCSGNIQMVVNDYLGNKISDSGETCAHHHEDGKQCNH